MLRKEDIIQRFSVLGLHCLRVITDAVDPGEAKELKKKSSYIHIYAYKKAGLPDFRMRIQPTYIIDLTKSEGEIFSGFNETCRKHIRRAERNSDLGFTALDGDFYASHSFYKKFKVADGAIPDIKKEFVNCLFFNAYYKGKMLVSMSFYDNGVVLRAKHAASPRKEMGEESKIVAHASRKLIWEVCKWGRSHGRKKFDLGGLNFADSAKAGINEFKRSFGGDLAEVYIYKHETPLFVYFKKMLNWFNKNLN